ncbi:hypothetical protein TWF696_007742 [Orbilia brochopaga]|uniref:Uncharacterized protein n=1 Tax=Orbilia brochopaga TaxID=3140254 RepID=A0AAV9UPH0_9PEZI
MAPINTLKIKHEPRGPILHLTADEMREMIDELERERGELLTSSSSDEDTDAASSLFPPLASPSSSSLPPLPSPSPTPLPPQAQAGSQPAAAPATNAAPHQTPLEAWRAERAASDAAFDLWVRQKMEEIAAAENAITGAGEADAGEEPPLPDLFGGESLFPPMEEVFPPEIWGTATELPRSMPPGAAAAEEDDADIKVEFKEEDNGEGPLVESIRLNGVDCELREEDLAIFESWGIDCSSLRARARQG